MRAVLTSPAVSMVCSVGPASCKFADGILARPHRCIGLAFDHNVHYCRAAARRGTLEGATNLAWFGHTLSISTKRFSQPYEVNPSAGILQVHRVFVHVCVKLVLPNENSGSRC